MIFHFVFSLLFFSSSSFSSVSSELFNWTRISTKNCASFYLWRGYSMYTNECLHGERARQVDVYVSLMEGMFTGNRLVYAKLKAFYWFCTLFFFFFSFIVGISFFVPNRVANSRGGHHSSPFHSLRSAADIYIPGERPILCKFLRTLSVRTICKSS